MKSSSPQSLVWQLFSVGVYLLSIAVAQAQGVSGINLDYTLNNDPATFDMTVGGVFSGNNFQQSSTLPGTLSASYSYVGGSDTDKAQLQVLLPGDLGNPNLETSLQVSDVQKDVPPFNAPNGGAYANMVYYFDIAGPANSSLPLLVSGIGGYSADTGGSAYATCSIGIPDGNDNSILDFGVGQTPNGLIGSGFSWSVNQDFTISANTLYAIDLTVDAQISGQGGGNLSAYIDPAIAVDPAYANANQYTVEFSSNLPSSVPEPSNWALMMSGLGLLAFWRIRTRRPTI